MLQLLTQLPSYVIQLAASQVCEHFPPKCRACTSRITLVRHRLFDTSTTLSGPIYRALLTDAVLGSLSSDLLIRTDSQPAHADHNLHRREDAGKRRVCAVL